MNVWLIKPRIYVRNLIIYTILMLKQIIFFLIFECFFFNFSSPQHKAQELLKVGG